MRKNLFKIIVISIVFAAALVFITLLSLGAAANGRFYLNPEDNEGLGFTVVSYDKSGSESYMFLPNTVDPSSVKIRCDDSYSSVTGDSLIEWNSDEKYAIVDATSETTVNFGSRRLIFMRSSLPSMSIVLNDGESLDTINSDKNARIGAKAAIEGTDGGEFDLEYKDIEMKTRGNTTFWPDKKPYQIKFDKKTDLFGMGKAKKWILLANYYDGTMIRTKTFFDLADEIGLANTSKSTYVDLYIDGDYRGVYQLIEKIEVGTTRVDLQDEAGVIIEMESAQRIGEETDPYFVTTTTKKPFVYKDYVYDFEDASTPERIARINEIKAFVQGYINEFEQTLFAVDRDWDKISSMIDVDSFILYYFMNEYGEQVDCTLASTYFYIDGPGDVLHCGPIWDFDRACAFNDPVPEKTDYIKNVTEYTDIYRVEWFKELFRYPEFVARANELYEERVRDAFDTEKVLSAMDSLQERLMPSLKMNHVKWVVFYNRNYTADELVSGGTENEIAYTTDSVKSILSVKKNYMDTVYGSYVPTISYTTYDESGNKIKDYTGGCMTYSGSVAGLKIELDNLKIDGGIEYSMVMNGVHTETVSNGEIAHSADGYVPANAIYVNLTGNLANYFSIEYRVHYNGRWIAWKSDGAVAGRPTAAASASTRYNIDRIQMRLVKKAEPETVDVNYVYGGKTVSTESAIVGNAFSANYVPTLDGGEFLGWFTDADCTVPFEDGAVIEKEQNVTLYAKVKESVKRGDMDGDGIFTAQDLVRMKRAIAGVDDGIENVSVVADLDGDGIITAHDVVTLKLLLVS